MATMANESRRGSKSEIASVKRNTSLDSFCAGRAIMRACKADEQLRSRQEQSIQ